MRKCTMTMTSFVSVVTVLIAVSPLQAVFCDDVNVAERPSFPHGFITISSLVILPTEFAAKELGLSDSQFSEIKLIRKESELLFHEIAERFSGEDPEMQADSDIRSRIANAAHTLVQPKLDGVLTSGQALRLEQIHWQNSGVQFIRMLGVPKYLKLSDSQAARIEKIVYKIEHVDSDSLSFRIQKMLTRDMSDLDRFNALERKALANVMGVLTDEQKKLVADLYGNKIDHDELARQTENLDVRVEYEQWDDESQMKIKKGLSMR